MNSSSTEFKRHEAVGLGQTPHTFENVVIIVDVIGYDDYVIDFNTWDIVEGDKYDKKAASAIVAFASRNASPASKRKNPKLNKVK